MRSICIQVQCESFSFLYRLSQMIGCGVLLAGLLTTTECLADPGPYLPRAPYEAPAYVPPPPPESKVHLTDNRDGTLTEGNGLMWTQKDSYADLGRCLNWYESEAYVKQLKTGGHSDWRMPTIIELYSIYDDTLENVMAWDHDRENPLHLDKRFADGAAYWYWSGEKQDTDLRDCCGTSLYFVASFANTRRLSTCANGGVRAVRQAR